MNSERTAFAFSRDTVDIVSGCPGWELRENEIDSLRQPGLTEIYLRTYNDYVFGKLIGNLVKLFFSIVKSHFSLFLAIIAPLMGLLTNNYTQKRLLNGQKDVLLSIFHDFVEFFLRFLCIF